MSWKNIWRCVKCDNELTFTQVMHSHGRCPKCGHKGDKAGTVVETYESAEQVPNPSPLWKRVRELLRGAR